MTTSPDPRPLLAALADMSDEALHRVSVAGMRIVRMYPDDSPVLDRRGWHALAALAADVEAQRRQVLDELERAFDAEDDGLGGIVSPSDSGPSARYDDQ